MATTPTPPSLPTPPPSTPPAATPTGTPATAASPRKGAAASASAAATAPASAAPATAAPATGRHARSAAPRVGEQVRTISRIDVTSAFKVGFLLGVALFLAWLLAAMLLYVLLGQAGVWDRLNSLLSDLTGLGVIDASLYFTVVVALGLAELVIFTLLAPLAAVVYNSAAALLGGLRVTLKS